MNTEAIVFGSARDGNSNPVQQLGNLLLTGFSTNSNTLNTDSGKLYGSFTKSGSNYNFTLYKDSLKTQSVCQSVGTIGATTLNPQAITQLNNSGITGSINYVQYVADDLLIQVRCFLSTDKDMPLANMEALLDYDSINGFAYYHLRAYEYLVRQNLLSDFKSKLWNPLYIDANALNNTVGGYDYSRVLNLHVLREASAYYALAKIAERQNVDPKSMWADRMHQSYNKVKAFLTSVEIDFDENQTRVESSSRALSSWKVSRA